MCACSEVFHSGLAIRDLQESTIVMTETPMEQDYCIPSLCAILIKATHNRMLCQFSSLISSNSSGAMCSHRPLLLLLAYSFLPKRRRAVRPVAVALVLFAASWSNTDGASGGECFCNSSRSKNKFNAMLFATGSVECSMTLFNPYTDRSSKSTMSIIPLRPISNKRKLL